MLHTRKEGPVSSEIRDTLGQYDLLIPIILRLVKRGASLEETIEEQINLDDKQMFTLRYMLKMTERTILVLDGLDEYQTKKSHDITDVMRGNTFKHVIITSRAEAANKTQEWKQVMYKEAELKGFSDENIKLYVDKFFKTSKELAMSLKSYIFEKDSNLLELARNPGSLCMLCILHNDQIPIHAMNREQLFQEYVAFLLSRWEQRQNPEGEKTPRSEILKKYHEILIKFGELANINRKPYTQDDDDNSDNEYGSERVKSSNKKIVLLGIHRVHIDSIENHSDSVKSSDNEDEYDSDGDDEDSMELSFTLDQIKSVIGEDALNYGCLYKSHLSSRLVSSRYSFIHKTLHEFFLAYFINHYNLESFKQGIYKNWGLLEHELSLTRFILHLHMSQDEAYEFTTNIIGSKPGEDLFSVLLKLYDGYQHDECQRTLTFSTTEREAFTGIEREYGYIYQYPCYYIRADRGHQDSLSSYNKDMKRRMNTDNKHKAVTVPLLQDACTQQITCDDPYLFEYDVCVCCRADYEVTVIGDAGKLEKLYLQYIEKVGDINLHSINERLEVDIGGTNLHGCVELIKPWMALIQSLRMGGCKLEAGDISVIAASIQACTSPTGAESASTCRLKKLDLGYNSLTGAGADIARIIPLCTEINLGGCKLEAGDISAMADSIQACTSHTGAESASPCRLQKLDLNGNSLTGAGADIARIIPLCTVIELECDLNDEDFHAIVNAIIQTHSDRNTSVHDHNTPDRIQTSKIKPASHGPASQIEELNLQGNKFSDIETVRLLLNNLPPSLRELYLLYNQFNEDEIQKIRRTYDDKHPNMILFI